MNKKQLAKLLIKHPEIKALYESREFDTSILNRVIAKEILRENKELSAEIRKLASYQRPGPFMDAAEIVVDSFESLEDLNYIQEYKTQVNNALKRGAIKGKHQREALGYIQDTESRIKGTEIPGSGTMDRKPEETPPTPTKEESIQALKDEIDMWKNMISALEMDDADSDDANSAREQLAAKIAELEKLGVKVAKTPTTADDEAVTQTLKSARPELEKAKTTEFDGDAWENEIDAALKKSVKAAKAAKAAAESEPEITPDSNDPEPTSDQEPTPPVSLDASDDTATKLRKIARLIQRLSNTDAGKTIGSTLVQLKKAKQEPVIPELEEYEAASTVLVSDGDGNVEINPEIEEELTDETISEIVIPIKTLETPEAKEQLEILEKEVETIMTGLEAGTVTSKIADQLKKRASTTVQSDDGQTIDNVFRPAQALQVLEQMLQQYQTARSWADLEELHPTKIRKLKDEEKLMDFDTWSQTNLGDDGAITKIFQTKIENFQKQIEAAQNDPNSLRDAEGQAVLDAEQVDIDGIETLSNAIENSMNNDASGEDGITGDSDGNSGIEGESIDDVLSAVLTKLGSSMDQFPTLMANDRFKSLLSLSITDQSGESDVDDESEGSNNREDQDSLNLSDVDPDNSDAEKTVDLGEALSGIYLEDVEPEETNNTEEGSPMSIEDATKLRDEIQRLQDVFSKSKNENVININVEELAKQAFGDIPEGEPGTDSEAEAELSGDAVEEGQTAAEIDAQKEQIEYQELCAAFIPAMDNFFSTAQATRLGFMEQFLLKSQSKMLWGLIADLTQVAMKDQERAYSNKPETDAAGLTGAESPEVKGDLEEAAMDRFFNRDNETVEISDEDKISLKTELKALLQALRYAKSMVGSYEKNMTQVSVDPGLDGSALKERLDKYLPLLQKSIAKIVERANEALVRATKLNAKEPEVTNDDEQVDAKPEGRPATTDPQPTGRQPVPQPKEDTSDEVELWEMMVASSDPVYPIMEKDSRDDIIRRVDEVYNSMRAIYTPVGEGEDSEGLRGFMETGDRARAIPQAEKMLEIATQEDFIKLFPGGRIGEGGMPATVNDAIKTMNREIKNLVLIMRDVVTLASKNEIPHPQLIKIVDSLTTISKTLENSFGAKMMISSETLEQIETRLAEEDKNKSLTNSPSAPGAIGKAGQLASAAIASLKKFIVGKGWDKLLKFLDSLGYFDDLVDDDELEKLIKNIDSEEEALKEMTRLKEFGQWLETIDPRQLAALRKLTDILKKQSLQEEMGSLAGLETELNRLNSTITPEQLRAALEQLDQAEYNLLDDLFGAHPGESAAFIANSINGLLKSEKDADDQAMPPASVEIDDEDPINQLEFDEHQAWQSIRPHLIRSFKESLKEIFKEPEPTSEVLLQVESIEKAFRSKFSKKTTAKDLKNLTNNYYWLAGLSNIIDELRPYLPKDLYEKIYGRGGLPSGKTKRRVDFQEKINKAFIDHASSDQNMPEYNKSIGKLLRFAKKEGRPFSQLMKSISKDIIRELPSEIIDKTKEDAKLSIESLWSSPPLQDLGTKLNKKRGNLDQVFSPYADDHNEFNSVGAGDFLRKIGVYDSARDLDFSISNFVYRTKNREIPRKILPLLDDENNKGKMAWIYYILADAMRESVKKFSGNLDSLSKPDKEALLSNLFLMRELDPYTNKMYTGYDGPPVDSPTFESIVEAMGEDQSELMKFSYNFYDLMLDSSSIDDESSSEPPEGSSPSEPPTPGAEPESPEPGAEPDEESRLEKEIRAKEEFQQYANKSEVAKGLTEIISNFTWENEQQKKSALDAAKTYLTSYVENALREEEEIDVDPENLEGLKNYINNMISESKQSGDDFEIQSIEANLWDELGDSEDEEDDLPKNIFGGDVLSNEEKQILKSKEGLIEEISDFAKTNFEKLVDDYKEEKRKEAEEEKKQAGQFAETIEFRKDSIKDVLKTFAADDDIKGSEYVVYQEIGTVLTFLKNELTRGSVTIGEGISDFIGGMKDKFNLRGLKSALVNNEEVVAHNRRKITPKMFEDKQFRKSLLNIKKYGMSDENIVKLIKYFLAARFNVKRAVAQMKNDKNNVTDSFSENWDRDKLQESLKPIIEAMFNKYYKH